jgi:CRP-like cAMP-binding protein
MPKTLQYKAGSLIYFQGDPADKVFILQNGKVNLSYQDIETGDDVNDVVQQGEFFGVKSALGRYPREENAMAILDATIMAFTVPEFETLAQANTRIIMKMLKVLSNQLRRIHKQVSSLMEKKDQQNPEEGLYSVGKYYLDKKNYTQARYVFGRYLTFYPSGKNAIEAAAYLGQLETAVAGSMMISTQAPAAPEAAPAAPAEAAMTDTAKSYYDAVSFISQQKYQQAYLHLKKIVDANEDPEYVAKSNYEIGNCLFLMNKFQDCIQYFTMMITKYPKHPELAGALFYMGQSYERMGRKDQAGTFYKKILSMPNLQDEGTKAKTQKALKGLEG